MHTALGKACALLWMVWLMTGPDYYYVQAFLASVYAIITDLGTERIVVNLSDVLPEFFVHIGCKVPADFVRGVYLFPFAIAISGWHHTFDGLVRYGLCSLAWFDPFWRNRNWLFDFCATTLQTCVGILTGLVYQVHVQCCVG